MEGRAVVAAALGELAFGNPGQRTGPWRVLALGKAAPAMLAGVAAVPGTICGPVLAVARRDSARPGEPGLPGTRLLTGDHPLPGPRSFAAGRSVAAFCDAVPVGGRLLCLLSGGASALVETPGPGVTVADLVRAHRWLIGSGLPVAAMNAVRGRLSGLKAGRLARRLQGRQVRVLAISDVPDDDPATIGSGPFVPSPPQSLPDGVPDWLTQLVSRTPPPPAPGDDGLAEVSFEIVAHADGAAESAAAAGRSAGLEAAVHTPRLTGDTATAAARVLRELDAGPAGLHVWAGETTVALPADYGAGGRNQHLALYLALQLAGRNDVVTLCSATDGCDGESDAAGGWADGGTVARGQAAGRDARRDLERADSGRFLAAAGDRHVTGPTGTNVMDLVLALKTDGRASVPEGNAG